MNGSTFNSVLTIADEILQLLGLENWQIQAATYNGIPLMIVTQGIVNTNEIPYAGAFNSFSNFIGNNSIPFGTGMGVYEVDDTISRRIVIHDIPGRDGNFMEDQGWEGETFTIQAIFFGIGYQVLLQQALTYMLNDAAVINLNRNVLIHPVRGTIENVLLQSYRIRHAPSRSRACVLDLVFKADDNPTTQNIPISPYIALYEAIAALQSLVEDIAGALSLLSILFTGDSDGVSLTTLNANFGSAKGNIQNINPLIRSQIDLLNSANQRLSNLLLFSSKLLYTYLKPANFNDFYLDPVVVDYGQLPELFRYVTIFTATEIGVLINFYEEQVSETIALYSVYNLDRVYPDKLNALRTSLTQLTNFAETLLQLELRNITQFKVPYDMSIREVCFLNDVNFNGDITQMLLNNRDAIYSTNNIPKDTIIKIRKPTNG